MKVAVSATGAGLEAEVDPRFGRCQYLLIVDTDTMAVEAIANPSINAPGGAGAATAQLVANKGVSAVLTGNCGPTAHQALSAAGIDVVTGVTGTVREAVAAYQRGLLAPTDRPNVPGHSGMRRGGPGARGAGTGFGPGRRGSPQTQQPR